MDGERPTEQILQQIAEAEGKDPTELSPLFEVIDPEALDQYSLLARTVPSEPAEASYSSTKGTR